MKTTQIRVGFISAVRHGGDYLRILEADDRVELVGIVEEPAVAKWIRDDSRRAAQHADLTYSEDIPAFLDQDLDLVVVCSEPTRHARLAQLAMESGHHVLVDKPAATTLRDAENLYAVAEQTGRRCAVVNRTHAPALRRLRAWVDAGHLGLPRHLDLEFFASGAHFATSVERPELVVDRELSGGGEILNFLGYTVDAAHYLTGLRTTGVHTFADALFSTPHRDAGVEDSAVVTLIMERGVTATITLGRVPYAPGGTPTVSSIRLLGSHGHAVADDDAPAITRFGDTGLSLLAADAGQLAVRSFLRHVIDVVENDGRLDYQIEDAVDTIAVTEAAYRSLAHGDIVTVESGAIPTR